jgi:hypothetical protein
MEIWESAALFAEPVLWDGMMRRFSPIGAECNKD